MVENFKEQLEESKRLKAEFEKLKAQLASVMPVINDRTSETAVSNKCSNMKDLKVLDDVEEVYECDISNTKVSVDVVLDEEAELSIPIKSRPRITKDAVGVIVGWPKELVIFPTTKKKGKPQPFALLDALGHRDKFKDIEKTLPMACKYIYSHVVRLINELESIYIEFKDTMFGRSKSTRLLREDILCFMEMREIGTRQILIYMGYLYKYLRDKDRADYVSFVDPDNIPTCPLGKDGRDISQHIADQLEAVCRDNICLIPYNIGYHWILTIVNEDKNMIYLLDSMSNRNRDDAWKTMVTNGVKMYNASKGIAKAPGFKQLTGNLKQSGSVECGYCVMRYMKEIVECENPQLEKMPENAEK
ncbi:uncharacterized protein LOC121986977 [Zingiber officinale]|uniref:uncharacterized protein LOC121986977 n=1 Tax=Zingiber officinale TaxID=94328 RepID=UPI001C4D8816|nr:uncharacterized protein LOC121986977 [Zingiber officinale]